jgi:hypothetical protein
MRFFFFGYSGYLICFYFLSNFLCISEFNHIRMIEVTACVFLGFPAEVKDFSSSLCVQTSSETHSASCTMGTGGPFPGVKRGRGVTLTTHTI